MPLQEFVPGDKVAYLVETATGLKACCGTVAAAETFTAEDVAFFGKQQDYSLLVNEDSGTLRAILPSKVDFCDDFPSQHQRKRIKLMCEIDNPGPIDHRFFIIDDLHDQIIDLKAKAKQDAKYTETFHYLLEQIVVISGEWETRGNAMDFQSPSPGGALF